MSDELFAKIILLNLCYVFAFHIFEVMMKNEVFLFFFFNQKLACLIWTWKIESCSIDTMAFDIISSVRSFYFLGSLNYRWNHLWCVIMPFVRLFIVALNQLFISIEWFFNVGLCPLISPSFLQETFNSNLSR